MTSIKPGRGPSLVGGVAAIGIVIIGIVMFVTMLGMGSQPLRPSGSPGLLQFETSSNPLQPVMIVFFIVFIGVGVMIAVYHFYNATQKDRMSVLDITKTGEEPDPVASMMGFKEREQTSHSTGASESGDRGTIMNYDGEYCPFCGKPVQENFDFCPSCGKDI